MSKVPSKRGVESLAKTSLFNLHLSSSTLFVGDFLTFIKKYCRYTRVNRISEDEKVLTLANERDQMITRLMYLVPSQLEEICFSVGLTWEKLYSAELTSQELSKKIVDQTSDTVFTAIKDELFSRGISVFPQCNYHLSAILARIVEFHCPKLYFDNNFQVSFGTRNKINHEEIMHHLSPCWSVFQIRKYLATQLWLRDIFPSDSD